MEILKGMGTIFIGTSGFSYREWIGSFYPCGLKGLALLDYYGTQFNAVEVNNTFYKMPEPDILDSWKSRVPSGFRFAVKAGQMITHRKDFGMPDGYFEEFLSRIGILGEWLGPVLFQFPPSFGKPERLTEFIHHLQALAPTKFPIIPVIELRNKKLLNREIFDMLRVSNLNLCLNDAFLAMDDWPEPGEILYIRLRNGPYEEEYLQKVAKWLRRREEQGRDCYVFFKHEVAAPGLAKEMLTILGVNLRFQT